MNFTALRRSSRKVPICLIKASTYPSGSPSNPQSTALSNPIGVRSAEPLSRVRSKVAGENEGRPITMTPHLNTSSGAERIDEDTREGEIARRNVLFGLWAGRHAGLEGDALEAYALSVHLADHRIPGHDDVIAKVAADLACCGKPMSDRRLRTCFREMALRASL